MKSLGNVLVIECFRMALDIGLLAFRVRLAQDAAQFGQGQFDLLLSVLVHHFGPIT
jgi:hypothetical protein